MTLALRRVEWGIFVLYSVAVVFVVWHHEMWRDELQTWGIAASSHTFTELIQHTRYEGHPMLWFVLVWGLTKLFVDPHTIQVFHTCLVLTTAYLVVFHSPFSWFEKLLILFSYYFLYEYAAISRNYQIGILLVCAICIFWQNPRENLLLISVLLFLLFQTNAFAFLLGAGISVGLLAEEYDGKTHLSLTGKHICAALIIVAGVYVSSLAVPPADASFLSGWLTGFNPGTFFFALAGIAHGFLPITNFDEYYFWSFSYVPFGLATKLVLGLILLVTAYVSRPKDRVALVVLCASVVFIVVFTYIKPRGTFRHFGHYTIALLAAYWIQGNRQNAPQYRTIGYFGIGILVLQFLGAINAWYRDVHYPFSTSGSLAAYIKNHYPDHIAVAGVYQDMLTAVRWYLQKPIYNLDTQEYGPYVIFNKTHWNDTLNAQPDSVTYARYIAFRKTHSPSILIMSYHSAPAPNHFPEEGCVDTLRTREGIYLFTCTKKFEGAITGENYYLFDVKRSRK